MKTRLVKTEAVVSDPATIANPPSETISAIVGFFFSKSASSVWISKLIIMNK
jgi:hypothetical protein